MSRVVGIELGAHSVKVVIANPGLRKPQVVDVVERAIPPQVGEPVSHTKVAAMTAGEVIREHNLEESAIFVAMPGDKVFLHVLEFGFRSLRRSDMARVVGAELDAVLPVDLEDIVYAYETIPAAVAPKSASNSEVGDDDPTFVGGAGASHGGTSSPQESSSGTRVLAAAMVREHVEEWLTALRAAGIEPKGLLAAPGCYARVVERTAVGSDPHAVVALVDVGELRTDVCVAMGGRPVFARTIARADSSLRASPDMETVALTRDIKRTLNACRNKAGLIVDHVLLVGGSPRVPTLAAHLQQTLAVAVSLFDEPDGHAIVGPAETLANTAALAAGVCFEGASGRPVFNMRTGPLAFQADFSFLRGKAQMLAVSALAIVALALVGGYTRLHKLRSAEEVLAKRVAVESAELFGSSLSAAEVLARVGPTEDRESPIPAVTAYDTLLAFNKTLPSKDDATLDIDDLQIKPDKLQIKAVSTPTGDNDALSGIKKLEESLRGSKCFAEVPTPESEPGPDGARRFSLSIATRCK